MQPFCNSSARLFLLGLFIALPGIGLSQLAQPNVSPAISSSNWVPLQHLYWHFLMYQHHLDDKAAQMEKEGNSGTAVRSLMQAKLKISDARYEPIHRAADRLSASMSDLNTRAQHLRSLYIQLKPLPDGPLTPEQQKIHDQLKKLNDEREELFTAEMNKLDNELAVKDRANFREFLARQIAPSVIAVKLSRPASQPSPLSAVGGGGK